MRGMDVRRIVGLNIIAARPSRRKSWRAASALSDAISADGRLYSAHPALRCGPRSIRDQNSKMLSMLFLSKWNRLRFKKVYKVGRIAAAYRCSDWRPPRFRKHCAADLAFGFGKRLGPCRIQAFDFMPQFHFESDKRHWGAPSILRAL